jgi:hypothetical protein
MPVAANWAILIGYFVVVFGAAMMAGAGKRTWVLTIPIVIAGWLGGVFWLLPALVIWNRG